MRSSKAVLAITVAGVGAVAIGTAVIVMSLASLNPPTQCGSQAVSSAGSITLGPPGAGQRVGATEYGGPGDPSSGITGASGANLLQHPDSYAELGGLTFQTATAMGGLPYMTPLRVTWGRHSAIGYKRDFGLGGGPIEGLNRVIDLWYQFAGALGIPYENGQWSGPVTIERPPPAGAGNVLAQSGAPAVSSPQPYGCAPGVAGAVPLTSGPRAMLLPDGQAAAPAGAPTAVKEMIAAGNQIVGKPYVYGGPRATALRGGAVIRLLQQRRASALRRGTAPGDRYGRLVATRVLR